MTLKRIIVVGLCLVWSSMSLAARGGSSQGGLYLTEGILAYQQELGNSDNPVTSKTLLSSETGIGYIFSDVVYVGGVFNYTIVKENISDGTKHDEVYQYYGPSLGYMGDNWFVIGHYFLNAEYRDNETTASGTTRTSGRSGNGFGVNVGYKFGLWGDFFVAPVIAYKNITYQNCKDPSSGATNTCSPAVTQTEFTPYFTLLVLFH